MTSAVSEPYRVPRRHAQLVSRALARGIRPMVANVLVLGISFVAILGAEMALLDRLVVWVDEIGGGVYTMMALSAAFFLVPWFLIYLVWRTIWFRIIARRLKARGTEEADIVFTADEDGIRVAEGDLAGHWMSWRAMSRILLVDGALVFARGTFGLIVPLAALGADHRPRLAELVARLAPEALAVSNREVRDVLAS